MTYCSPKQSSYTSQAVSLPQVAGEASIAAIRFPRTNQKQLVVSAGVGVHMYDIARAKVRKSFQVSSPVTCLAVNYCDAYIAAGAQDGSVSLLTVASLQVSPPLVAPKCSGQRVTSLCYSKVKPSLLASSHHSGTTAFWDVNAMKVVFSLSPHLAPCTCLVLSPINDTLCLCVGLDRRLVCLDTRLKKQVLSLEAEAPLTAADFHSDGATMAVGTSRGRILNYDLRSPRSPFRAVSGHKSSVASLVYQHRLEVGVGSASGTGLSSSSSLSGSSNSNSKGERGKVKQGAIGSSSRQRLGVLQEVQELETEQDTAKGVPQQPQGKENLNNTETDSPFPVVQGKRDSLSSQLFSPLKESSGGVGLGDDSAIWATPAHTQGQGQGGRRASEARRSTDGLFSPLRDSFRESIDSPSNVQSLRKQGGSGFSTPLVGSPLTCIEEESGGGSVSPQPGETQEKLSLDRLSHFLPRETKADMSPEFAKDRVEEEPSSMVKPVARICFSRDRDPGRGFQLEEEDEPVADVKESLARPCITTSSSKASIKSVLTAFPGVVLGRESSAGLLSGAADDIAGQLCGEGAEGETEQPFHRQFVRGVVQEAMGDWTQHIERRLWDVQYGFIRQLQQHQEETRSLLSEVSGLSEMKTELELLRRENRELRKFFGNTGLEEVQEKRQS